MRQGGKSGKSQTTWTVVGPNYLALCSHTGIVIELVFVSWFFSNSVFLWAPRSNSARDLTWGVGEGAVTQQSFAPLLGRASL